jgi:hypothetical protein
MSETHSPHVFLPAHPLNPNPPTAPGSQSIAAAIATTDIIEKRCKATISLFYRCINLVSEQTMESGTEKIGLEVEIKRGRSALATSL